MADLEQRVAQLEASLATLRELVYSMAQTEIEQTLDARKRNSGPLNPENPHRWPYERLE